jgi:two-component system chemotaxis response regulator CheY
MRILIAEDDLTSRLIITEMMKAYGECDVVVNGEEAFEAFRIAHDSKRPYDLILMDIMMPGVDGLQGLKRIREMERSLNIPPALEVKVVMVTALSDPRTVIRAYYDSEATSYIVKPVTRAKIRHELEKLKLVTP